MFLGSIVNVRFLTKKLTERLLSMHIIRNYEAKKAGKKLPTALKG